MGSLDDRTQYQVATNIFSSEGQILWSRYAVMLAINTILLTLIGFTFSKDFSFPFFPVIGLTAKLCVPLLGIVFCYFWHRMTKRGYSSIDFWITQARKIEEKPTNKLLQNPIKKGLKRKNDDREKIRTEQSAIYIIHIFAFVYLVMLFGISTVYILSLI